MGYSESGILIREIPVRIEVKPVIVGVEPDDTCSQLIFLKKDMLVKASPLFQCSHISSLLLIVKVEFYGLK